MAERAVIIGAGQAGAQGAISLRQSGFDGEIVMFGDEPHAPYQRPPLSKAYLQGEFAMERLLLRPVDFYAAQDIELRLGEKIVRIDRSDRAVLTYADKELPYDKLLLATGAPPRRLNCIGAELENIFYLRGLADSDALRAVLTLDGPVVIVGAGYIGLEVAAVMRKAGRDVTVLEMAPRVLARVAGEPVSSFFETLHRDAGVNLRLGAALESFAGDNGKVCGARLQDGELVEAAAVLIGIGSVPETTLAAEAGLKTENGVWVDDHACTEDVHIWAAGDCTNFPFPRYGRRCRLESVPNAIEQAKVAAANMAGGDVVYDALPWFWSDQYDVKLQTAGLNEGYDEIVVRGAPDEKKFAAWYLRDGRVLAVDAVNDPISFSVAKKLIDQNQPVDARQLADNDFDLKTLIARRL